ncbi:hypothetical protein BGZ47_010776, partial [Haplosporangium gracile]
MAPRALWTYYMTDPKGKLRKELLESQQKALMEKQILHVDVDGDVYRQAIEEGVKRRRVYGTENEGGDETLYNQSSRDSEALKTPPPRAQSPTFISRHLASSPSSLTMRQVHSTEEDVVAQIPAALALLNQTITWTVDDVDLLSRFTEFKGQAQPRFSLALDGIADVTPGSAFSQTLSPEQRMLVNDSIVSDKDIEERWPSLSSILARVCARSSSYDDVVEALSKEVVNERIIDYLRVITNNYSHYLDFSDRVPEYLNEREGFGDLTWPFIRGALTLVGIRSRCFEIPIVGTKERKNYGRDLSVDFEEQASMADGVALFEDHQIYMAEASLIHEAKQDKGSKDKFKVVRCMRDSWNSQIRSIARESIPPKGLTVFGSASFGEETKFYAMDFTGVYRLREVGNMLVPLRKSDFARRMKACVRTCLRFALDLEEEIKRRMDLEPSDQDLRAACDMIEQTRTTPTKE